MRLNEALLRAPPGSNAGRLALISEHAALPAAPGACEGGHDVYAASLARELALAGVHVDIFTRRDAPGQKLVVQLGEKLRLIHVPAGPARALTKEQLLPCMPQFAHFVTRFARRQPAPYDIVHANCFMSGMVAQALKRALGLPFVISFHALGEARRQAPGPPGTFPPERTRIEARLMDQADRVIAECAQDRLDMKRLYGAARQRITVAPRGFDRNELWPLPRAAARAQLGLAPGRFTVLQLGSDPGMKAIFLDKDGALVDKLALEPQQCIDPRRNRLGSGACPALRLLARLDYRFFVVCSQPGIAQGRFLKETMGLARDRLTDLLFRENLSLDGFYYCPHDPLGSVAPYAITCHCRKPLPGLLLQAAAEHGIDLRASWMIGSVLDDIEAGNRTGCRTVLLDNGAETEWRLGPRRVPTRMAPDLYAAAVLIARHHDHDE